MPGIDSSSSARLDYSLPSRLEEIAALANAVEVFLAADPQLAFQTNLCLEELLTNTILHGLRGAPGHVIRVSLKRMEKVLEITLTDDAPPFDPFSEAPPPDLDADLVDRPIGGLGVHFVRTIMDEYSVSHDGSGNRVVLRKLYGGDTHQSQKQESGNEE